MVKPSSLDRSRALTCPLSCHDTEVAVDESAPRRGYLSATRTTADNGRIAGTAV